MSKLSDVIEILDSIILEQNNTAICAKFYNDVAVKLEELYNKKILSSLTLLLPSLQQKVNDHYTTINQTKVKNTELQELINQEIELEKKTQNILTDYDKLQKQLNEIEELKKKKTELEKSENQFNSLENDIKNIILENDKLVANTIDILDRINISLKDTTTKMDDKLIDVIKVTQTNLTHLKNTSKNALSKLDCSPLETCSDSLNKELDRKIGQYNQYVEKIISIYNELIVVEKKYSNIEKLYKDRFECDKSIYGNLDERGNVESYLEEHTKDINIVFQDFEKMLSDLIKKRGSFTLPEIYEKQYDIKNN